LPLYLNQYVFYLSLCGGGFQTLPREELELYEEGYTPSNAVINVSDF